MAGKNFGISVVISGVDRITGVVGNIQRSIAKFHLDVGKRFKGIGERMGLPAIGAAAGRIKSALGDLIGATAKVGGALAAMGAGAVAGFWSMYESVVGTGDALDDLSRQLGVNAEALQEWRYAAQQNGVEAEEFDKSLEALTRNMGKAQTGKGPAKLLDALGIKKVNGQFESTEKLLPKIADKLKAIRSPATRAAVASELFGKAGGRLLPMLTGGSEGLKEYAKEARALGLILSNELVSQAGEAGDNITRLQKAMEGAKNTVAGALMPAVDGLIQQLTSLVTDNQAQIKEFADNFAKELPGRIEAAKEAFGQFKEALQPVVDVIKALSDRFGAGNVAIAAIGATLTVILVPAIAATITAFYDLGVAMLTTPVGWFLIIIGALAYAVYKVYENWKPITEFFSTWWQSVKDAFSAGIEFVAGIWEDIRAGFKEGFLEGIITLWNTLNPVALILRAFTELVPKLRRAVAPIVDLLPDWVKDLIGGGSTEITVAGTQADMQPNVFGPARWDPAAQEGARGPGALLAGPQMSETTVRVDIANMPPGTRVQSDSKGPAQFELNQGYAGAVW